MEQRALFLLGHLRASGTDQTTVDEIVAIVRQLADSNRAISLALIEVRKDHRKAARSMQLAQAELFALQETYSRVPCVRFGNWLSRIFRRNK